jgi:hypothetical protein
VQTLLDGKSNVVIGGSTGIGLSASRLCQSGRAGDDRGARSGELRGGARRAAGGFRMKALRLLLCLGTLAFAEVAPDAPAAPEDPRDAAKREAWTSAVLIVSLLELGDNHQFPGIRAWLEDFRAVAATTPPPSSGRAFPIVDSDALVTRNPHFWTVFYEVQPADPGLALLHSALLLSAGEAQRAAAIAIFGLQRPGIPEEIKRGLVAIVGHCQSAQARSAALVQEGIKLHDRRNFDGALRSFEAALAEWPANGVAYYERGSTLRVRAIEAARHTAGEPEALARALAVDPPETTKCFALARRHDPLQLLAYQGDDPALLNALMTMVRTGLPAWEAMRKHPEQPVKLDALRSFREACHTAGIEDFALVLHQLVVATHKQYYPADRDVIVAGLQRLAPAALTPALLDRVSGTIRPAMRQIAVPVLAETFEIAEGKVEAAEEPKKSEPVAEAKGKKKTTSAKTSGSKPATKKSKKRNANTDAPSKSKSKSKAKKRAS